MSLTMKALTAALHTRANPFARRVASDDSPRVYPADAPVPARLERRYEVDRSETDGMSTITLAPCERPSALRLIYLHGGAYVNPLVGPHWAIIDQLLHRTGATITVPSYPLAPEYAAAEAFPKLRALIDELQADDSAVSIAGDSAGAGLALSLAIQLRNAGARRPASLVLFSPWLDVTMSNPAIAALEARDPMLSRSQLEVAGRQWAADLSTRDPRISPIYDTLEDLPPTYLYQGGQDLLLPDAKRFTAKARQAGSHVELRLYPDAFHVFVGAPFTPEARRALTHAAFVLTRHRRS